MVFLIISFVALSCLVNEFEAIYIVDNDIDVRIVSDDNEFCNIGRIEFYNGMNWGSFTDCSNQFTLDIASSVCQTLGWDDAESFRHGPYQHSVGTTAAELTIAYTNIHCPFTHERHQTHICDYDDNDPNDLLDCDICSQCQLFNHLETKCPNVSIADLHRMHDIYVICSNQNKENDPMSNLYNWSFTNTHSFGSGNSSFESCSDAFANETHSHNDNDNGDTHGHMWKILVIVGISIGFLFCAALYCKSTTRMPHKKFTEAYMANLENDDDILLDTRPTPQLPQSSNYTSLADKMESLLD